MEAKKTMGEIFNDLESYVNELSGFYTSMADEQQKFVPESQISEVERFKDSIRTIKEMFSRDKMKVVFFGRTSNGKSTVINAMLHSKVLPQGMGHTTSCFLQVEGGSENEKHFVVEGSNEKMPIGELNDVGHALSTGNSALPQMGQDSLCRIFYPKSASKLLQNDVVIVDSPGVDLSPQFDSWIDKHCLDADVFVLVCNAESTLTQAEKSFFQRVNKKLSKPNIFILNNRWDASASESDKHRDQVRNQHMQRFVQFLVDELKVCTQAEAKDRFFFISAREMLENRLKVKGELPNAYQQDGFQRRAMEFENFENHFEKCISKSAIRTKFEAHDHRAREIIQSMRHNLDVVYNEALHKKQRLALEYQLKSKELTECRDNFLKFEQKYLEQQKRIRAEVHLRVSTDFHEEVNRLESIIDNFDHRFVDEPAHVSEYKRRLAEYVDKVVTTDLQDKCTGGLTASIWSLEQEMFNRVKEILGGQFADKLQQAWGYKQPFKFTITINCPSLVEDFHEDLEFRFSLGIDALFRRFLSFTRGQPITSIGREHYLPAKGYYQGAANNMIGAVNREYYQKEQDQFMANMIMSSASYLANGSVGVAIVGALIYKSVGWRVIAGGVAVYGGLYAIERLRWNASAKEQHLKDQFRSHLSTRLRQVGNIHTTQCEAQVVRELDQVHQGLKAGVASAHREMKENIDSASKGMEQLDEVVKGLSSIRGKTNFLSSSLEAFATKFLTPDSP